MYYSGGLLAIIYSCSRVTDLPFAEVSSLKILIFLREINSKSKNKSHSSKTETRIVGEKKRAKVTRRKEKDQRIKRE